MSEKKRVSLDELLRIQNVKQLLGKLNPETDFRRQYRPEVCGVFSKPFTVLKNNDEFQFEIHRAARKDLPNIIKNRVQDVVGVDSPEPSVVENYGARRIIGVVFSGGPAPGGHNVVAGIYDAAKRANPENIVYGFLLGPDGVIENEARELTDDLIDAHRNRGGFSMIKTGRTKIDSSEKVNLSRETCKELGLDALVVVGGDDSNTNAAFLAQELMKDGVQVIGVPKTIDGDIQVRDVSGKVLCAMSFGFHSAARAFSQEIANLCTDSSSDVKYWHVCKVMGRVASHLALEVALQTHANMTLIGEDLADYVDPERIEKAEKTGEIDYTAYGLTLRHLSRVICKGIVKRAAAGKNYGVIVIPEGVLEFINEVQVFILKLSTIIADYNDTHDNTFHADFPRLANKIEYLHRLSRHLVKGRTVTPWSQRDYELFNDIPDFFQEGLLAERDSHGNFQFSQVQTEKVLMELVKDYLEILRERGEYKIGISADYFRKTLEREGLEPDIYGPVLFDNYHGGGMLRMKDAIFSLKTLKQALVKKEIIASDESAPAAVKKIYSHSVPKFKTQNHFYGYDGRGADPTKFDCDYTYNLGWTAFSLVANGSTGQMAAVRNLEKDFAEWTPAGIPIAPLMHLEERKGKLALVIEKSIVDITSGAFRVVKALREKWLAAHPGEDDYRRPGPIRLSGVGEDVRPITLTVNAIGRGRY